MRIPVRDPGEPGRLDQPRAAAPEAPLQITPEGDVWFDTVQQLVAAEAVTALVRELALQSQLVARDAGRWVLRIERESLGQGNTRERLAAALGTLGHAVQLAMWVAIPAMLVQAGFAEPVMDMERITLTFDSPERLLKELRTLGRNLNRARFESLRGRQWRDQLHVGLRSGLADNEGRLALTFEIIYGHAMKAQPKVKVPMLIED